MSATNDAVSPTATSIPTSISLLVFRVGDQECALALQQAQEIVPMATLMRPPGLPSLLEGFLNLRGTAVPVLHLHRLFHADDQAPGLYTPLIILRGRECPVALMVDTVSAVLSVSQEALLPVRQKHTFNDCATAEVVVGRQVIHLLSPERILLEQERQLLAELQAVAQRRLRELEGKNP